MDVTSPPPPETKNDQMILAGPAPIHGTPHNECPPCHEVCDSLMKDLDSFVYGSGSGESGAPMPDLKDATTVHQTYHCPAYQRVIFALFIVEHGLIFLGTILWCLCKK